MPTSQETFDIVVNHLRTQGHKAMGPRANPVKSCVTGQMITEECKYRGDNGAKCAAGCLIPDSLYTPDMEGLGASDGRVARVLKQMDHDLSLVVDLQDMHDNSSVDEWEKTLQAIAEFHDLEYTAP